MKARQLFEELRRASKRVEEKDTLIYVSTTVTDSMKGKVIEIVKNALADTDLDEYLGIITKNEAEQERIMLFRIWKSLVA